MLARSNPEHAEQLLQYAQEDIDEQWSLYQQMAGIERTMSEPDGESSLQPEGDSVPARRSTDPAPRRG
jgi:hypothetical protein